MEKRWLLFVVLLTGLCVSPLAALGQQETATITGTVKDESGAIVPRATVIVTNIQTNIKVQTQTDDAGLYVIPSLRPGAYSVSAESPGFRKTVRTGVTLQVAQVAPLDLTLATGQLSETVDVVGGISLLETQSSSRGLVIDQKNVDAILGVHRVCFSSGATTSAAQPAIVRC